MHQHLAVRLRRKLVNRDKVRLHSRHERRRQTANSAKSRTSRIARRSFARALVCILMYFRFLLSGDDDIRCMHCQLISRQLCTHTHTRTHTHRTQLHARMHERTHERTQQTRAFHYSPRIPASRVLISPRFLSFFLRPRENFTLKVHVVPQ